MYRRGQVLTEANLRRAAAVLTAPVTVPVAANPVVDQDLDTKGARNAAIAAAIVGQDWKTKAIVRVQTADIPFNLAVLPANVDGIALAAGSRFFTDAQSGALDGSHIDNGLWLYTGAGLAATRPTDFAAGMGVADATFKIARGTDADKAWSCKNDPGTDVVGTDALTFGQAEFITTIDDTVHGSRGGGTLHPTATIATRGFLLPESYLRKLLDPAGQNYDPGVTSLVAYTAPTGCVAFDFDFAKLPPKVGDVSPGIRMTFSTSGGVLTTVTVSNPLPGTVFVPSTSVDWNKDGQFLTQIEFIGTNAGIAQVVDLGEFQVHGRWQ
jgi:hypothetical protein